MSNYIKIFALLSLVIVLGGCKTTRNIYNTDQAQATSQIESGAQEATTEAGQSLAKSVADSLGL